MPAYPSTIGRLLERSARRTPDRLALTFADRRWTYAELDRAAGRVAAGLLALGLEPGDRVAAFGKNSDAYLLLFVGCARAGLVHVPVNFNARGDELAYLLTHSEPRIAFVDPALTEHVDEDTIGDLRLGTLRDGDVLALGARRGRAGARRGGRATTTCARPAALHVRHDLAPEGRDAHPPRARARVRVVHRRRSTCPPRDVPLHALPLYHSAQMHVFLMPSLALGATNHLVEAPDVDEIFDRVPARRHRRAVPPADRVGRASPTTRGSPTRTCPTCARRTTARRSCPCPCCRSCSERLPGVGFYNCFGQSEIGPLATVLRPEEHDAAARLGRSRRCCSCETRVVDEQMHDVAPGELGEVVYRSPQLCTGYWGKPEETEEAFARRLVSLRRPRARSTRRATCSSSTASRT